MRNGFLASLAGLLAGSALTLAQSPPPAGPAPSDAAPKAAAPGPLDAGVTASGPISAVPAGWASDICPSPYGGCARPTSGCTGCGAGGHAPDCLSAEPQPTPYLPRSCPTGPDCAPQCGGLHWPEHVCAPDLYITGGGQYLAWWIKNDTVSVPVVSTNPAALPILGQPGTTVALGNESISYNQFSGARFLLDFWHDSSREQGVEATFFGLAQRQLTFKVSSDAGGNPAIGVPFSDALTGGQERVSLASFPGAFAGGVSMQTHSDLWGVEGNLLCKADLWSDRQSYVWFVAGFRYLDLSEDIGIQQQSAILPGGAAMLASGAFANLQGGLSGPPPGQLAPNQIVISDQFRTRNQFFGGQFGLRAERQFGDAFIVMDAKLGVGDNIETIKIVGATAFTPASPTNNLPAGLFAATSNTGKYTHSSFAVVPQIGLQAGYYLTPHIRGYVGYDFLEWTEVIRPGEQLDRDINRAGVPSSLLFGQPGGPATPVLVRHETDFWAQGISFGLDFTY
jgi:hypothetical protein